jgi:hypothetical protein
MNFRVSHPVSYSSWCSAFQALISPASIMFTYCIIQDYLLKHQCEVPLFFFRILYNSLSFQMLVDPINIVWSTQHVRSSLLFLKAFGTHGITIGQGHLNGQFESPIFKLVWITYVVLNPRTFTIRLSTRGASQWMMVLRLFWIGWYQILPNCCHF